MDKVRFIGRHIKKNGLEYFSYSGCGFEFDVQPIGHATITITLISELRECEEQYVSIYLNDIFFKKEKLVEGENQFSFKINDKNNVTRVRVVKLNETYVSSLYLKNIELQNAKYADVRLEKKKLIEFYGDSLTCGFGNLGKNTEGFKTSTEDFTKTYAYLASFALKMDYSVIARSGISAALKIYCDKTFDEIYDTVDMYEKCDVNYHVDYAVINLGTNDMAAYNELDNKAGAEDVFFVAYKSLVDRIISHNKDVKFILCTRMATLLNEDIEEQIKNIVKYIRKTYLNPVKLVEFVPNDLGSSFHPNILAQKESAKKLVEAIKSLK